jgi:hypothetical protein
MYLKNFVQKTRLDLHRMKMIAEAFTRAGRDDNSGGDFRFVMREIGLDEDDLTGIASTIEDFLGSSLLDFSSLKELDYVRSHLRHSQERMYVLKRFLQNPDKIEQAAQETEFPPALIRAYQEMRRLCTDFQVRVKSLDQKLEAAKDVLSPKVEKIEKLYHASIKARELYEHGFSEKRPEGGGMGLGGSVEDGAGNNAISFTYDPKYALEIARWLKEAALVAQGKVKPSQIMLWADKEHVADKTLEYFMSSHGGSVGGDRLGDDITYLKREGGKWKVVLQTWTPGKGYVESLGDIDLIFHSKRSVYQLYVAYALSNPFRDNPVSMDDDALLERLDRENVDPRDIGVIVAEIDMTDPDISYKPGEREYRVPPRSIKKIVKFM